LIALASNPSAVSNPKNVRLRILKVGVIAFGNGSICCRRRLDENKQIGIQFVWPISSKPR
jgi:hypothetical protein